MAFFLDEYDSEFHPLFTCPDRLRVLYGGNHEPLHPKLYRTSQMSNNSKNGFEVSLDVQQFCPNELSVKVVNNYVVVEGNHEERKNEHGFVSRQFKRRYILPDEVNPETVQSTLSSDGVLTISAAIKVLATPANERAIPITITNTPVLKPQMSGKGDATPHEKIDQ